KNDLNHLGKYDLEKGLLFAVSQKLGGLILSLGNGLDSRPVDLGKVSRIVQGTSQDDRGKFITSDVHAPQIERTEIPQQKLQHQRRASHNGNIELHQPA